MIRPNPFPVLPDLIRRSGLASPQLVLIDVGCSGGIDPAWTPYAGFVRAYGIDPLVGEIERLKARDGGGRARYFDGFVVGPPAPDRSGRRQRWFDRVSAIAAHQSLQFDYASQVYNSGLGTEKSSNKFTIDEFCGSQGLSKVDFLKSDTDGHDLAVLQGAEKSLAATLGVCVEATFATEGGGAVFREIDAFMDTQGFYLAALTPKHYTRAALPGRFNHAFMSDTADGATSWGEFLYLRDIVKHGPSDLDSAVRLALVSELFSLADVAAEALVAARDQAPRQVDVLLDGLVKYSAHPEAESYRALMERFQTDPRSFAPNYPSQTIHGPGVSLPLASLQAQNGGSLALRKGSLVVATPGQQWAYAASAPLALPQPVSGRGTVRVRLQVDEGTLGIGVLERPNAARMLAERGVDATPEPVEVEINLASAAEAESIVLRSWSPNGAVTRARIFSIDTTLET